MYILYTNGPGETIYYGSRDYDSGMWIAHVRAPRIREAYRLLARQIGAPSGREPGIVRLDSSAGPMYAGWPWKLPMSKYGPGWSPRSLPPKGWPRRIDEINELERTASCRTRQRLGMENQTVFSATDIYRLGDAVESEMRRAVDR